MQPHRNRFHLFAAGCLLLIQCLFLSGCCASCIKVQLPEVSNPVMQEVVTDDAGGLDSDNTRLMLINLELYKGALDQCNMTIHLFNSK